MGIVDEKIRGDLRKIRDERSHRRYRERQEPILHRLLPHQAELLNAYEAHGSRYTCLAGGVGSGKTDAGSFKAIQKHQQIPADCKGAIFANTYPQLMEATIANFLRMLAHFKIPFEFKRSSPPTIVVFGKKILCYSLSNYEKVSGVEFSWAWIDEAWDTCKDAWDVVKARVREPSRYGRVPHEIWLTTTLNGFDWIYEEWVEKKDKGLNPDHFLVRGKTFDNVFVSKEYQASLIATYDPQLARQMLGAEFVAIGGNSVYSDFFNRFEHTSGGIKMTPRLPLDWSLDFNIKPMCSVIGQVADEGTNTIFGPSKKFFACDEIVLDSASTWDAAHEFINRYGDWPGMVRVFGDASGWAKSTQAQDNASDFIIVKRILTEHFGENRVEFMVPRSNPRERDRIYAVNARLMSADKKTHFRINRDKCPNLIRDLENVQYAKRGKEIDKSSSYGRPETHPSDALGYWIHRLCPIKRGSLEIISKFPEGSRL